ncbi:MAG: hypothetical protein ACRC57_03570 [Sarcina sp.]
MGLESKWIEENIVKRDESDIKRRLKEIINFKLVTHELLKEENSITGKYTLLGFSIRELGRTAEVMYGYEGDIEKIYSDYLAQAITDKLKENFEFEFLDEKDYDSLIEYGKFLINEIQKLCTKEIFYTLVGLYKNFK